MRGEILESGGSTTDIREAVFALSVAAIPGTGMLTLELWLTFVVTAIGAVFIPGPGVLLTMAHSLEYGSRKSVGTIVGCLAANMFHQMLVAVGIGGIVLQYHVLLDLLKYLGAAYLMYLGAKQILSRPRTIELALGAEKQASSLKLFFEGFSVMAVNPRSFLFFLAFFPLFIDNSKPFMTQFLVLGVTFTAVGATALGLYASFASAMRAALANRNLQSVQGKTIGSLLLLSGLWFALR